MTEVKLNYGAVEVHSFGAVKLHAYATKNPLAEECFILEKGDRLVVIESVSFYYNLDEFNEYVRNLRKEIAGIVVSYHASGGTYFKDVRKYSSKEAMEYTKNGHGKILTDGFLAAFGQDFNATAAEITDIITDEHINVGGIDFTIKHNTEAFDIEIPEINSIYIHMLGADYHSIVAGENHANSIIDDLKSCITKKYNLVLTSHHTPERLRDVETKIAYLEKVKALAKESQSALDFKDKVKREYPDYLGKNYLDMTAGFFFE